jgi:hypothetical protein
MTIQNKENEVQGVVVYEQQTPAQTIKMQIK